MIDLKAEAIEEIVNESSPWQHKVDELQDLGWTRESLEEYRLELGEFYSSLRPDDDDRAYFEMASKAWLAYCAERDDSQGKA